MEMHVSESTADGGRANEAQAVYQVLSKYTIKPTFLKNVGVVHKPLQSGASKLLHNWIHSRVQALIFGML